MYISLSLTPQSGQAAPCRIRCHCAAADACPRAQVHCHFYCPDSDPEGCYWGVERESPPVQVEGRQLDVVHTALVMAGTSGRVCTACAWLCTLRDKRKLLVSTWLHVFPLDGFCIYASPLEECASMEVQKFSGHLSNLASLISSFKNDCIYFIYF